jgi:hypothetical protein
MVDHRPTGRAGVPPRIEIQHGPLVNLSDRHPQLPNELIGVIWPPQEAGRVLSRIGREGISHPAGKASPT